jgi:hypothetical protein
MSYLFIKKYLRSKCLDTNEHALAIHSVTPKTKGFVRYVVYNL